jgi:hypothetical protein
MQKTLKDPKTLSDLEGYFLPNRTEKEKILKDLCDDSLIRKLDNAKEDVANKSLEGKRASLIKQYLSI